MANDSGAMRCCASCGINEGDGVKLRICTACHLVRYCGVKCQKEHRKEHKRACKKRAAELHDKILFKQPGRSFLGDCPICFLPLPIDDTKSILMSCCCKVICGGCYHTNLMREAKDDLKHKCPFCRKPVPTSDAEVEKRIKDRAEMNDPVALGQMGAKCRRAGDYHNALKYYSKAAELDYAEAHYDLAVMYHMGDGVEKDESKDLHHTEQAAILGHPDGRYNLGSIEWNNGRHDRAIKHWVIAAKLGHDESLTKLKMAYKDGIASKDDFDAALRGHQASLEATKSPQR